MTKIVSITDQKLLVAECFNNQFMFNSCFKAWIKHSKKPEFKIAVEIQKKAKKNLEQKFFKIWL